MKYKYILAIAVLSLSVLMFSGCRKNDAEPVTSEAIEESEPTEEIEEPDEEPEPEPEVVEQADTSNKEDNSETNGSDVEINGEAVGNTALTQEEIDAIKSQMSSVTQWEMDAYKAILENGSYTDSVGVTWDKVVGTPGDTSWRRMSDEEANAIISKGKPDPFENPDEAYEYQTAEAELSAGTWCSYVDSTIYFDYYAYQEARDKSNKEWREAHADELGDDTNENLEPTQEELDYWSH